MSSAFDLHSSYMSQAWRTLRDSIILKLDKLERHYPANHAGTPSGAHKWHMFCPNHNWANVDNGHVWQHPDRSWHCLECEKQHGTSRMKGDPWFTPREQIQYDKNNGKAFNTTDRHLQRAQEALDSHRSQKEWETQNPPEPQTTPTDLGWGYQRDVVPGTKEEQTHFKVN